MSEPNLQLPEELKDKYIPIECSSRYSYYAIMFATIVASASVASNFMASKVWTVFGFTFDGGLILYPLTFIFTDVIIEIYSKEQADHLNNCVCFMNIVIYLSILIMNHAKNYAGANAVDLSLLYGRSLRIMLASVVGYWTSHWTNNFVHEILFDDTDKIGLRSWGSSLAGHFVDTIVFNLLAFFGVINGLFWHMVRAFIAVMIIETIICIFFIRRICLYYDCKIKGFDTSEFGLRKGLAKLLRNALRRVDEEE